MTRHHSRAEQGLQGSAQELNTPAGRIDADGSSPAIAAQYLARINFLGVPINRRLVRRLIMATAPLTFAALLLLASAGQLAWGDALPPPSPEGGALEAAENLSAQVAGSPYGLGVGDRLRIKIYEREDLSGESVVRTDGSLVVPLLGVFKVAGRQVHAIEKEIQEALFKLSAKTGFVSVDVVEWRHIYTIGVVATPGAYPFVPGMTVLHALAAAGGFHRPISSTHLVLEAAREANLYKRSKVLLSNVLAREARVLAELAGKENVEAPRRLVELVGTLETKGIIAAENRLKRELRDSYERQVNSMDDIIELTDKELVAVEAQYARAQGRARVSTEELVEVEDYAKRGLTHRSRLFDARRTAITAEGEARAVLAALARTERILATAKRDRTMLDTNRRLELEQELKTTREEVDRYEHDMQAAAELVQRASGEAPASNGDMKAIYKIMRLVSRQQMMIDAEETTPLQPGDLVRVSLPATGLSGSSGPRVSAQSAEQ